MINPFFKQELMQIRDNFIIELEAANRGKKTSFAYSIHTINLNNTIKPDAQVIVVGGSNFHSCLITNEKLDLETYETDELPDMTKMEILLLFIEKYLNKETKHVVLNFAFPMEPVIRDGRLDGNLIKGTKGHSLVDCVGKNVGQLIEEKLISKGIDVSITVANDTVCLILSGLDYDERSNLAGGIVGTGCNFGFFRDNGSIVNIESGNFSNFTLSKTAMTIDQNSDNPGEQLYEKEIAGAYLYEHYNLLMGEDLLSDTAEVSKLAEDGDKVARDIIHRSACLVAAKMAAIYNYRKKSRLTFVIEGSLFWKGWNYNELVREGCSILGVKESSIKIYEVEHSSLKGAVHLLKQK